MKYFTNIIFFSESPDWYLAVCVHSVYGKVCQVNDHRECRKRVHDELQNRPWLGCKVGD